MDDFINDEAEISGDEVSSDESENGEDIVPGSEDEVEVDPGEQHGIRSLQMKQQQNRDDEDIERIRKRLSVPEEDSALGESVSKPVKKWTISDLRVRKEGDDIEEDGEEEEEEIYDGRQFIENEAELSGSDASSDEEEGDDDDKIEEDEIDPELPDEEEQREDILRVQVKQDLDDELRQVKEIKNRLFADGDLYREGLGPRQKKFKWRDEDDDDDGNFENDICFNSDDEESDEETDGIAQVKINYKPLEGNEEGTVLEEEDEEEKDEFETMAATRFEGAFGGPAGSILSYVIRDRSTHEKMTDKRENERIRGSRYAMKRKRPTRRGPAVKTVTESEKRKLFSRL